MIAKSFYQLSKNYKKMNLARLMVTRKMTDNSCKKSFGLSGSQNYTQRELHPDLHEALNRHLHKELTAFYSYLALECYFNRHSVGLLGFAKLQSHQVEEELKHAQVLTKLLAMRRGNVNLRPLQPPKIQDWSSPLAALKDALQVEKATASSLADLHLIANSVEDAHVADIIQSKLMNEQMQCMDVLMRNIHKMELCSSPECLLIIDLDLQRSYAKP